MRMAVRLFVLLMAFPSIGMSQTKVMPDYIPAETLKVARCVLENCASWTFWKAGDKDSAQAVFIDHGKRYTLYANLKLTPVPATELKVEEVEGYISFWIRPDGTKIPEKMDTLTVPVTGPVVLGIGGKGSKMFDAMAGGKGAEYRDYWQARANDVMAVAFRYFQAHARKSARR